MARYIDAEMLVRYKDCRYGKPLDTTKVPYKYYRKDCIVCHCEEVVGDEPMPCLPHHFCSYGEKE